MSEPLLFLDIDGVLNAHEPLESGYCGICHKRVWHLNAILDAVPDLKIVLSSAWRYLILKGDMTVRGFESLLLVHGIKCYGRLLCCTEADGDLEDEPGHFDVEAWRIAGLQWRADQIRKVVEERKPSRWAVLDDLPLGVPNLVQTNGDVGLTAGDAHRVVMMLSVES